jgi:hypothetical protein
MTVAQFITSQDPRWRALLARTWHDFHHMPEYVELCARYETGRPAAFYAEDGEAAFLAPLLIRPIPADLGAPEGWCDSTVPYGYPSPLLFPVGDSSALRSFLKAFKQVGAEYGLVTAFFRMHPLLPLPEDSLVEYGRLVWHGQTVSIDLSLSLEEIWSQMRRGHKKDIRRLKRAGFRAEMDRWELYDRFVDLYKKTMERLSADEFYFFDDSYFSELRSTLGEHLHLSTVLSPGGELTAGGLITSTNGLAQGLYGADSYEFRAYAPSKLAYHLEYTWAKEAGNHTYHLGGGVGGQADSLFYFKAGFSKRRHDFYTFRMILDEDKYATLNNLWSKRFGGANERTDYFPPYRRTAPESG